MTPDDAFLADIIAAPDDDGLRLIYADYLDERGDPRGEFVRVQIELARLPDGPGPSSRRLELEARERALLLEHEREWAGLPPRVATEWTFERGFLAGVKMPAKGFSRLRELFASCPTVRHLHLAGPFKNGKPSMQAIASSPYLARLTSLTISDLIPWDFVGTEGVEALASSPHLSRLTTLRLPNCWIGDKGCRVLAGAPNLTGLTTLDLSWNAVGGEGVQALLEAPYLARLIKLDLRCNHPLTEAMKELLRERLGERVVL
jgi:uncharacterized protein (TIGR02996 family)